MFSSEPYVQFCPDTEPEPLFRFRFGSLAEPNLKHYVWFWFIQCSWGLEPDHGQSSRRVTIWKVTICSQSWWALCRRKIWVVMLGGSKKAFSYKRIVIAIMKRSIIGMVVEFIQVVIITMSSLNMVGASRLALKLLWTAFEAIRTWKLIHEKTTFMWLCWMFV